MVKKFAINCISDELNHPIITKIYRTVLTFVVLGVVVVTLLDNQVFIHKNYTNFILNTQTILFSFILIDFIFRIIGSSARYDMESNDGVIHYNSIYGYLFSYYEIIDFISVVPFFLHLFSIDALDFKTVFSLMTLLKLARFSPALIILKDVIVSERKSLLATLYLMVILTISISTVLYFVERDVNPNGFGTLLDSIWWSIITLATVGYGDVVPYTALGKLLGGIAAITGFGMFALPAGILASGFAAEVRRLRDITNWNMVTKVSLFSDLEFGVIADISKLLHVKRFRKNEVIIKEGTRGDAMYFIFEGSVLVHKKELSIVLNEGDFFGEISLIKNIPRTATVIAKKDVNFLNLLHMIFKTL